MAEVACGNNHEERDRRMAADTIGFDALEHRIERFKERVRQVENGEGTARDDDYLYTSEELMQAYDDAEAAAHVVIEAYLEYKKALKNINDVRSSIEKPNGHTVEQCRSLGIGALQSEEVEELNHEQVQVHIA